MDKKWRKSIFQLLSLDGRYFLTVVFYKQQCQWIMRWHWKPNLIAFLVFNVFETWRQYKLMNNRLSSFFLFFYNYHRISRQGLHKNGNKSNLTQANQILLSRGGTRLGSVVRRPISANPGLNYSPRFFFFCSKTFPPIIFLFVLTYPVIKL